MTRRSRQESSPPELPRRIVAMGGGTGLPVMLRGLRGLVPEEDPATLTAVVTMSDDGGSSGRLRRTRGLPPPGDVRNCLVALSAEADLVSGLFQHRYEGTGGIGGHNLGNLILAALAEQTGSFIKAVEASSLVLRTVGRILPVTLNDVTLEATLEDGARILGESSIGGCVKRIRGVRLLPDEATPTPGVIEAIREADLVVIGPGSLFTSVIPNLILEPVARAMRETSAVRILVGNLVSEHGEDAGLELVDHLGRIEEHAGGKVVDALLAHDGDVDEATRQRYEAEGATPLRPPGNKIEGVRLVRRALAAPGPKQRHDPLVSATAVLAIWRELVGERVGVRR